MAAKRKAAAAAGFSLEQVEAIVAKALAAQAASQAAPVAAPVRHGFRPCDPVLIREEAEGLSDEQAKYIRSAGVVERVDENGATVDMDLDHKRVSFPASALKLLKA